MKSFRIAAVVMGLCVWSLGASLHAELIIEDTFTGYPDNALISAHPAGPATGLTGDSSLNQYDSFYVNRTQLDLDAGTGKAVYDYPAGDNGARIATRNTSADHVLFENNGDVFYASFLIDPARADGTMTFELELAKLDDIGDMSNFSFGIIGGNYIVGNGGNDVNVSAGMVTTGEQLILVRVKYGTVDSGPGINELVTLWVNPVDESSTPVINDASTPLLNSGGGKITAISIRGDQMNGAPALFDNLRVGTSFATVLIPEPSTLSLLALGLLALAPIIRKRR